MGNACRNHRIATAFVMLMLVLPLAPAWSQDDGRIGTVMVVEGTAEVRQQQATTWEPLRFRDGIFLNDSVRTAAESKLKVLMNDESIITVVERSEMQFTEFLMARQQRRSIMQLVLGKIRVLTTQLFGTGSATEVRTPNTVTGVRGSEFVVQHTGDQTTFFCAAVSRPQLDHCFMRDPQDPTLQIDVPVGHLAEQVGLGIPAATREVTDAERQSLLGDTLVKAQIGSEVLPTSEQGPVPPGATPPASAVVVAPAVPPVPVKLPSPTPEGIAENPQTEALTPDTTPTAEEAIRHGLSRFNFNIPR
jgi:hypothetical protein